MYHLFIVHYSLFIVLQAVEGIAFRPQFSDDFIQMQIQFIGAALVRPRVNKEERAV
jgi:hypothetical protein